MGLFKIFSRPFFMWFRRYLLINFSNTRGFSPSNCADRFTLLHLLSNHNNKLATTPTVICEVASVYLRAHLRWAYSPLWHFNGNCKVVTEGNKYLLLNVNNRYFIPYGVLYKYSEFMKMSRKHSMDTRGIKG